MLYDLLKLKPLQTPSTAVAALLLVLGLASKLTTGGLAEGVLTVVCLQVTYFTLCWTCFADPSAGIARLLCWTPLRWLGNMSYSYYLVHGLALLVMGKAFEAALPAASLSPWGLLILLPLAFAWTLLPSAMMFILVERPLSLDSRRGAHTNQPSAVAGPTADIRTH